MYKTLQTKNASNWSVLDIGTHFNNLSIKVQYDKVQTKDLTPEVSGCEVSNI